MSRSPERRRRAGLASALAAGLALAGAPAWAQPAPPPADAAGQVLDVVGEMLSLDGAERQSRAGQTVTVTLAGRSCNPEHPPQPTGSMKAPASTGARVVIVGQRGSGPTIGGAYARIAGQRDR